MLAALEKNALAASNEYKGERVTVTGTLDTIDASGNYFTLRGDDRYSFQSVRIDINKNFLDTVSGFTTGQSVTVTGTVSDVGEIMGFSIKPEIVR